jgi:hypothetical protein
MNTKRPSKLRKQLTTLAAGWQFPRAVSLSMVAAVVALSLSMPAAWAAETGNDFDKLENKILHVTYPKETSDQRLDRLEKTVFGEAKDGSDRERLDRLLSLVPQDDERGSTAGGGNQAAQQRRPAGAGSDNGASNTASSRNSAPAERDDEGTTYPAVSAIEKKLFGKEFAEEPVETRLTRLEKKTFGKQSASNDLSERMDALKVKTGIDIARQPSDGTDWNDDEDDTDYPEPSAPVARRYPGVSPSDSGMSFSGRNLGQDLNRAFNRRPGGTSYGGGSGSYGMGGGSMSSSGGSGSYGFGGGSSGLYGGGSSSAPMKSYGTPPSNRSPRSVIPQQSPDDDDDNQIAYTPPSAPTARRSGMPPVAPSRTAAGAQSGGLTVQLDALETQVLGKTYQEPMMQRLERLEGIVFPGDKSARSRTPAERVARISGVLGGSTPMAQNQQASNPELDGYADQSQQQQQPDPMIAQQNQRRGGGLGKIINSLGSFLGGGMSGMSVGSYPMQSGTLVTDPTTGYLMDQSGNLINPTTGAIMGRRAGVGYPTVPGYGMNFNNGFASPYSNPYMNPMYSNPMYGGIGGSGIRFGTGSGIRFGGGF